MKKNLGYVFATKMLVDEKRKVRFMYREEATDDNDSGWRFFCGDEDQEYVENPDNTRIYDIETILNIDKSVSPYLQSAIGVAFERENESDTFRMSTDFAFEAED